MTFVHGKDSAFKLDDAAGTLRVLTSYTDSVSGLPGGRGLSEVTAMGDGGVKSIPGLANTQFSIKGHFDSTATTGPYVVLNGLRTATATASFEFGPEGSVAGKVKILGECWLTDCKFDASVAEKVSFDASFQVDGLVTTSTF